MGFTKPVGSGKRFLLVRNDLNPREIYRGSSEQILQNLSPLSERALTQCGSERHTEKLNLVQGDPGASAQLDWKMEEAARKMTWLEKEARIQMDDQDDLLRALCVALGPDFVLTPEPPMWGSPTRAAWMVPDKVLTGSRLTTGHSVKPADGPSAAAVADFGVTRIFDIQPCTDQSLVAAAYRSSQCLEVDSGRKRATPRQLGLYILRRIERDEIVYVQPGDDMGRYLEVLLEVLLLVGLTRTEALTRIHERAARPSG